MIDRLKSNIPLLLFTSLIVGYFMLPLLSSRSFLVIYLIVGILSFAYHYHFLKKRYTARVWLAFTLFAVLFILVQNFYWDILNAFTLRKFLKSFAIVMLTPGLYFAAKHYDWAPYLPVIRRSIFKVLIFTLFAALGILFYAKSAKWIQADLNRPLLYSVFSLWGIAYWLLREKQALLLGALLASAFLIYFKSYSETSLLCLMVGGITLFLLSYFPKLKFPLMAVMIFLVFALPFLLSDYFFSTLLYGIQHLPSSMPQNIFTDRLDIWHGVGNAITRDLWSGHSLLGHGYESTRFLIHLDPTTHLSYPLDRTMHPHNIILQIWFELGVLGIILFAFVLLYGFRWIASRPKEQQPYWFAYLVVVFAALNVNFSYGEAWLITGISFSFLLHYFVFLPRGEKPLQ